MDAFILIILSAGLAVILLLAVCLLVLNMVAVLGRLANVWRALSPRKGALKP